MTTLSMSKIRAAVVVAFLAVVSGSTVLRAQNKTTQSKIDVPFAFEVGSVHFAPGTYTLTGPRENGLSVRGVYGSALAMNRHEVSLLPATSSRVVFNKYGNRYFLREVWTKDSTDHLCGYESKAERQVERPLRVSKGEMATTDPEEVALLLATR